MFLSWGLVSACFLAVGAVALPAGQSIPGSYGTLIKRGAFDVQECINVSTSNPRWEISNLAFTTINYNTGGRTGDIRFNFYNPAVETTTACTAENIDMSGGSKLWHDCSVVGTGFQFSLTDYGLKLRGTWSCGDDEISVFNGEGTLSSSILICDDYPFEARGWQTVCQMANGIVQVSLSTPTGKS
ncbi:hypothetical protein MFIFM68171_06533 [Madurella fahalii]|uniref:AA1-like domain-containing protein n=1 Tax=Madurella fahalii TaxID=1157608 RepID=A0ABQ0GEY7_9PEZI